MNMFDSRRGPQGSLKEKLAQMPGVGEFEEGKVQAFVVFELSKQYVVRFGNGSHIGVFQSFQEELDRRGLRYNAFDIGVGQGMSHEAKGNLNLDVRISSAFFEVEKLEQLLAANLAERTANVQES